MIQVVAAIIAQNKKILIARRAAHKAMPGKWEFPGGKIEPGETPERALERELLEEFGIKTKTGRFISKNIHHYPTLSIELLAYHSEIISGSFTLTDHDQIAWEKIDQIEHFDLAEADLPILLKIKAHL